MDAEKFYSPQELERQYNVRDSRADYETKIVPDWINRSAITRTNLKSAIDISYGNIYTENVQQIQNLEFNSYYDVSINTVYGDNEFIYTTNREIQTVNEKNNPRYYKLINAFKQRTGCPTIVNTSFNVRGEPIVCSPQDAYRCFMRTEMDVLVLQNQILYKTDQPKKEKNEKWKQEFELD